MSNRKEIKQEWINEAKALFGRGNSTTDESNHYDNLDKLTEAQLDWFGDAMVFIKEDTTYDVPSGTECRRWPRAFFSILNNRGVVKEAIDFILTSPRDKLNTIESGYYDTVYRIAGFGLDDLA